MYINDIPLSEFKSKLLTRVISPAQVSDGGYWPKKASLPFMAKERKTYYKQMDLAIELKGTPLEIEKNKSLLMQSLKSATVDFKSLAHKYTGELTSSSISTQETGFEVINVTLMVYEHGYEETINLSQLATSSIFLNSNKETPVILTITPTVDLPLLLINGLGKPIALSNLTATIPININGETGEIEQQGQSKYEDYDSWGYPKLMPGENEIFLSESTLDLSIRFSPLWE